MSHSYPILRVWWLSLLLALPLCVQAQGEYSTWYFGQHAGLQLVARSAPQVLLNGRLISPSACATLSDAAGNLLLYSNGEQVWTRQHQLMAGGQALGGNADAAQGCTLLRSSNGASAVAYIFTQRLSGPGGLFSTGLPVVADVQLGAAGGLGQVVQTDRPVVADTILQRLGERQFAPYQALVRHANGHDVWLLTRLHERGIFLASLIDGSGTWPCARTVASRVFAPRVSSSATWVGTLVASPDGRSLLYNDVASSFLLSFDPATGRVSAPLPLTYPTPAIPIQIGLYALGGAFSPDGQRLYLSHLYQPAGGTAVGNSAVQVVQYDLAAGSAAAIAASGLEVYSVTNRNNAKNLPYYSQRGPDGVIYFAVDQAAALDAILVPNARGRACRYTPGYQLLGGKVAGRALPGTLNDVNLGPLLATQDAFGCPGQRLVLRAGAGTGSGSADSLRWNLGDGRPAVRTTVAIDTLVATYPSPGSYTLRIDRRRQGAVVATTSATVYISAAPVVRLAQTPDTSACAPLRVQLSAGPQPAGTRYRWQDGSTASTLTAVAPGLYWVDVVNAGGCVGRASVQVSEIDCPVVSGRLPTIITPNGDALNQTFVLKGLNAPNWNVHFYNRWGREVYAQEHYDNGWAAPDQPAGVYYYLLRNPQTGQQLKGWVEVVR